MVGVSATGGIVYWGLGVRVMRLHGLFGVVFYVQFESPFSKPLAD